MSQAFHMDLTTCTWFGIRFWQTQQHQVLVQQRLRSLWPNDLVRTPDMSAVEEGARRSTCQVFVRHGPCKKCWSVHRKFSETGEFYYPAVIIWDTPDYPLFWSWSAYSWITPLTNNIIEVDRFSSCSGNQATESWISSLWFGNLSPFTGGTPFVAAIPISCSHPHADIIGQQFIDVCYFGFLITISWLFKLLHY